MCIRLLRKEILESTKSVLSDFEIKLQGISRLYYCFENQRDSALIAFFLWRGVIGDIDTDDFGDMDRCDEYVTTDLVNHPFGRQDIKQVHEHTREIKLRQDITGSCAAFLIPQIHSENGAKKQPEQMR